MVIVTASVTVTTPSLYTISSWLTIYQMTSYHCLLLGVL
jgi:hypothetical protein